MNKFIGINVTKEFIKNSLSKSGYNWYDNSFDNDVLSYVISKDLNMPRESLAGYDICCGNSDIWFKVEELADFKNINKSCIVESSFTSKDKKTKVKQYEYKVRIELNELDEQKKFMDKAYSLCPHLDFLSEEEKNRVKEQVVLKMLSDMHYNVYPGIHGESIFYPDKIIIQVTYFMS